MTLPRPRTLRGRLLLIVAASVVAVVVLAVIALNMTLRISLLDDARTAARERAEVAALSVAEQVATESATPAQAAARVDAWTSVDGVVHDPPRATPAARAAARQLLASSETSLEVEGESAMLGAADIAVQRESVGRVVAAVPLSPYERTERHVLIGSAAAGLLLVILVVAITAWALRSALRPIDEMTTTAASWSQEESDQRFERGDPVDEVSALASMLDRMLDRMQASLRHEKALTAEVSHELRTPLARIVAEADLALRDDATAPQQRAAIAAIRDDALRMDEAITALLATARRQAEGRGATCDAVAVARDALAGARPPGADGVAAAVEATAGSLPVSVEPEVLGRIIAPLAENAFRHACSRVTVRVERAGSRVRVIVEDDGPGVPPGEAEEIFEPGSRGSNARGGGSGLGLPLARRMARAAGGDVRCLPGSGGCFEVTVPHA